MMSVPEVQKLKNDYSILSGLLEIDLIELKPETWGNDAASWIMLLLFLVYPLSSWFDIIKSIVSERKSKIIVRLLDIANIFSRRFESELVPDNTRSFGFKFEKASTS